MIRGARWQLNRARAWLGRPRLVTQLRPVVIDERDRCANPIFLLGIHRSGTSLVRRLFNAHPEIACPPESFFIAEYARMLDDPMVAEGYAGFGMDAEAMRADLARKASELHEAFRIGTGKAVWADKTPQYVACAESIDRLFARRARYAIIARHPLDVVHSIWRRGWRFNAVEDGFESALVYVRDMSAGLEAFAASVEGRCARIRYEKLCADPEAELSQALSAIGLKFDPAMLAFAGKQHNYGLEDPVIHGKKAIEASSGAHRSWTTAQQALARKILGERARFEG